MIVYRYSAVIVEIKVIDVNGSVVRAALLLFREDDESRISASWSICAPNACFIILGYHTYRYCMYDPPKSAPHHNVFTSVVYKESDGSISPHCYFGSLALGLGPDRTLYRYDQTEYSRTSRRYSYCSSLSTELYCTVIT